jgi:hypothetical protein
VNEGDYLLIFTGFLIARLLRCAPQQWGQALEYGTNLLYWLVSDCKKDASRSPARTGRQAFIALK